MKTIYIFLGSILARIFIGQQICKNLFSPVNIGRIGTFEVSIELNWSEFELNQIFTV